MSNVLVISTSLRAKSNSDILTEKLIAGAKDAGHQVEHISLKGKEIRFCIGCLACQKTQKCVLKDDAVWIAEKVKNADTLVFATPIYYYEMSGQMKTLLDRNPEFDLNVVSVANIDPLNQSGNNHVLCLPRGMVENVGPVVELLKLFLYFLKALRLILDQLPEAVILASGSLQVSFLPGHELIYNSEVQLALAGQSLYRFLL